MVSATMDLSPNPKVNPRVESRGSDHARKEASMARAQAARMVVESMERKAKEKEKVSREAKVPASPKASQVVAKARASREHALPVVKQVTVPRIASPAT